MDQVVLVRLGHDVVSGPIPVPTDIIDNGVDSVIPLFKLVGGILLLENSFAKVGSKCHGVAPVEVWRAD
jgi:hypothetical protein